MTTATQLTITPAVSALNPQSIYQEILDYNKTTLRGLDRAKQIYSDGKNVFIYYPETRELMTLGDYHAQITEWHEALMLERLRRQDRFNELT